MLELDAQLLDDLLALANVFLCLISGQPLTSTVNREAIVIKQASNLANDQDVLTLIVTSVAPTLHWFQLWKLLLPVAQYMRLDSTQVAYLTDGEIAFPWDWRLFVVIPRFQHRPLLGLLVFVPDEMSLPGVP